MAAVSAPPFGTTRESSVVAFVEEKRLAYIAGQLSRPDLPAAARTLYEQAALLYKDARDDIGTTSWTQWGTPSDEEVNLLNRAESVFQQAEQLALYVPVAPPYIGPGPTPIPAFVGAFRIPWWGWLGGLVVGAGWLGIGPAAKLFRRRRRNRR